MTYIIHKITKISNHTLYVKQEKQFIIDRCKVGYTYRTNYKCIFEEFTEWKTQTITDFKFDNDTKNNIKEYLNTYFFPAVVYQNDNTQTTKKNLNSSSHGVWGITLKNDNTNAGIKIANSLKKKLIKVNIKTKEIIATYDSLANAARITGMSPSHISTMIKFKKAGSS